MRLRFVAETLGEVQLPNGCVLSCRWMFEEGLGWRSRPEGQQFRRQMVYLPALQRSQPKHRRAGGLRFLQPRFGEQEGNVRKVIGGLLSRFHHQEGCPYRKYDDGDRKWQNNLLQATPEGALEE